MGEMKLFTPLRIREIELKNRIVVSPMCQYRFPTCEPMSGGSLKNRMRLAIRVAQAVREVLPERLPLFFRVSATDWREGGWDLEQAIELARELRSLGVDVIDVLSGGTLPRAKIPIGPGYQVPFAAAIRKQAGIPTTAPGMITDPTQATMPNRDYRLGNPQ
jgi:2,4-dienoyl-CoA reductase-like NADH-dependent reductase (Old Yellow Enzyme family)